MYYKYFIVKSVLVATNYSIVFPQRNVTQAKRMAIMVANSRYMIQDCLLQNVGGIRSFKN